MIRISGVSPQMRPAFLENRHIYDLCLSFEEIATRIPALKKVDTYDPKVWRKYFDKDGAPLELTEEETVENKNTRDVLQKFLHTANNGEHLPPSRPSRRKRKLLNQPFKTISDEFKGLFD